MTGAGGLWALWWAAAGLGAAYAGLFLATRRPVSLRPGRVGVMAALLLVARAVLHAAGWPLAYGLELIPAGVCLLAAAGGRLARQVWLVRASAEGFRQELEAACRGLFLTLEETRPGRWLLSARGKTASLTLLRFTANVQGLVVPRPGGMGKVALLVQWLSKQYPGPVPRVRIVLTRSKP